MRLLMLDTCQYEPRNKVGVDQIQGTQSKPVILFAFGGGFKGGRRDNPDYISYFHFLARAGYVAVSTDYRTHSILVPFVLAYIFYAWRSIDRHKITEKEMDEGGHSY